MDRGYQHNFSRMVDGAMYDHSARERKAQTILAVLDDFSGSDTQSLQLLDIGTSTGIIDSFLADHFLKVIGIDIDKEAIEFAQSSFIKNNLEFRTGDAMNLEFSDNEFDIVVCTHIYEHVPDADEMTREIFRILKPGGICYFAAGNRLSIMEPHYKLPFLSILPRSLAHLYMKIAGKGSHYHEKHLMLPGLKKLVSHFVVHDYTKRIIEDPEKFSAEYMLKPGSLKHNMAKFIATYVYWLCPSYIWILEKPDIK
jgi:2-polyprenyl-3-methyl-5-hydroxy-6-metoxy-1,4-benzoquinol methylase